MPLGVLQIENLEKFYFLFGVLITSALRFVKLRLLVCLTTH